MADQQLSAAELTAHFLPVSKAEWLQQIARDLKDGSPEDLTWLTAEGLAISPFAHVEDLPSAPAPLSLAQRGWAICEDITVSSDAGQAAAQAIEALEGGVEALCFHLPGMPDATQFNQLTQNIYLDYISLHFSGPGVTNAPALIPALLLETAGTRNIDAAKLRGTLSWNPVQVAQKESFVPDWRYITELLAFVKAELPGFRVLTIAPDTPSADGPVAMLNSIFQQINTYCSELTKRGIATTDVFNQIQVEIPIGKRYFVEIATLRAFKILWFNFCKKWNTTPSWPLLSVRFAPDAYDKTLNSNMIRATTMAMSAVLGGANRLTVAPFDAYHSEGSTQSPAFARRIARNVQHLLKMESYMDMVGDPAAGSYYIEQLTQQIAAKAWDLAS
jgi:methylmalonyl-CoA mutase